MSLEKHELIFLLRELKDIFATKKELDEVDVDIDLDSIDIAYVGENEPENENAIWFDSSEKNIIEITYENPIIDEIFASIRTLQDQVKKLQEDVEYLKLYGGGGSGNVPDNPNDDEVIVDVVFALEDGGLFLLEDGGFLILEESISVEIIEESTLALEDGNLFLLEDGGYLLLEESINKINDSILLLENGARLLFENGQDILLESNNF
jgi:hypothetical protein